jgi:predicted RNA-binding protein with RPS1 domain
MDDQAQVDDLYEADEQVAEGVTPPEESSEEPEQEAWLELEESLAPKAVDRGDLVTARVVDVQDQMVVLDLGTKYEGFIPRSEFTSTDELPQVGEDIQVSIVNVDEEHERIRVSKRRADYEKAWAELYEALKEGRNVTGMVTERVRGGLRVNVGLPGFIPASQVVSRDVRHLDRFVGRTLPLKIVEVDRRTNKVVLSHKAAVEEERGKRREKTMARLYEGAVCEGRVVSLTDYGAFIDLGGVDGLLHVSEMAWHHVSHPSEVIKKGDIVRVVVLSIEDGGGRISLSRREILPDPWKEITEKYSVGDMPTVEITRIVSTGAFARPPEVDVEGFIPMREMAEQRIKRPEDVLKVGQQIAAKIIDLQPQAHKMTLSLVAAGTALRRQEVQGYMASQSANSGSGGGGGGQTLGDRFGDILMDAKAAIEGAEEPPEETLLAEAAAADETPVDEAAAAPARKPRAKRVKVETPPAEEVPEVVAEVAAEAAPEAEEVAAVAPEPAEEQAEELAAVACEAPAAVEESAEPVAEAAADAAAEHETPSEEPAAEE